jgi:CubicO group peptidase (beta-lactamase class C family)
MKLNFLLIFIPLFFMMTDSIYSGPAAGYSENSISDSLGFSAQRLAKIDKFFLDCIEQGILPNAQAYISRHGKTVYSKSFGYSNIKNKTPLDSDAVYRLASQTKAITTTAMMMLFEDGKFLLDDPVYKYIPQYKTPAYTRKYSENKSSINPPALDGEITIRNLLTHTSGIPYYEQSKFNKVMTGLTFNNETISTIVPELAKLPLDHKPGTYFTYGYGLDVIGYLIEKFSGMPLDEFFRKRIFEPIGMPDTYFYLPQDKAARLVPLYEKDSVLSSLKLSQDDLLQNYSVKGARTYFSGGAGLVGTLKDYAKFCQMLLNKGCYNGTQFLSPRTVEMMTTNQIGDLRLWDTGNKFGLGFEIMTEESLKNILGSVGSYKWGGMFGTEYIIDPKEDMVLIFYSNVYPFEEKAELMNKFRNLVYQALIK